VKGTTHGGHRVVGEHWLSPRTINTIVGEVGRIHDLEVDGPERQLGTLRPHDARHTFAYRLSAASGHNRAELERRLGHANDRYRGSTPTRPRTSPPAGPRTSNTLTAS